jgi:predicted membrane GTPase involved in stress response
VRLEYRIPARGLIGFQRVHEPDARLRPDQQHLRRLRAHKGDIGGRKNGVLISMDDGEIFTYALGKLDDRGRMFVKAGDPVYEGMIVGIHSRDNDLVVNATRTKQLTNFRVSRQGRRHQDHAADRPDAGVRRSSSSRTTSWSRSRPEHPRAQAPPEGTRPQAGEQGGA